MSKDIRKKGVENSSSIIHLAAHEWKNVENFHSEMWWMWAIVFSLKIIHLVLIIRKNGSMSFNSNKWDSQLYRTWIVHYQHFSSRSTSWKFHASHIQCKMASPSGKHLKPMSTKNRKVAKDKLNERRMFTTFTSSFNSNILFNLLT